MKTAKPLSSENTSPPRPDLDAYSLFLDPQPPTSDLITISPTFNLTPPGDGRRSQYRDIAIVGNVEVSATNARRSGEDNLQHVEDIQYIRLTSKSIEIPQESNMRDRVDNDVTTRDLVHDGIQKLLQSKNCYTRNAKVSTPMCLPSKSYSTFFSRWFRFSLWT